MLGFAGLGMDGEAITLTPQLPPEWRSVSFAVHWRGRAIQLRIAGDIVRIAIPDGDPVQVRVCGDMHAVQGGARWKCAASHG